MSDQKTSPRVQQTSWVFIVITLMLSVVFMMPYVIQQVQYALVRGRLQAEADFARDELGQALPQEQRFRLIAQRIAPSVVQIETRNRSAAEGENTEVHSSGRGSGIIIDAAGHVLTNDHVVAGAEEIKVRLSDGQQAAASVVGTDPETDLALLKMQMPMLPLGAGLTPAEWGNSDELQVGDWVLAIGSPFGLERSVTAGIVSAKGRRNIVADRTYQDFLQTDAAVNPGNSGGPLVNGQGQVVGINVAIVGSNFQGVSFAIPSSLAREICDQLRERGGVKRGYLGIRMENLTAELAAEVGLPGPQGVVIRGLDPQAPASQVGLRIDDVIIGFNGQAVRDIHDLGLKVAATSVGTRARVEVLRNGQPRQFYLVVAARQSAL